MFAVKNGRVGGDVVPVDLLASQSDHIAVAVGPSENRNFFRDTVCSDCKANHQKNPRYTVTMNVSPEYSVINCYPLKGKKRSCMTIQGVQNLG